MQHFTGLDGRSVRVGHLTRAELLAQLALSGVQLNDSAATLLHDAAFDNPTEETVQIVECSVGDLGQPERATLTGLLTAAQQRGLSPCPAVAGPYLRLATLAQENSPDSVMSNGRAPAGSVTIAAAPLRPNDDYPKGFYLRVVDGTPWLRGFRCTDEHIWSPTDRLAFRLQPPAGVTI